MMAKFVTALLVFTVASSWQASSWAIEPTTTSMARIRVLADAGDTVQKAKPTESDSSAQPKTKRRPAARTRPAAVAKVDAKVEQSVLQLVEKHLPEVDRVLDRLRKSDPTEYSRAIRDLAKSVRRLESAKKRDEALFEIEIQILKARSNVNLLTATLKVRDKDSTRDALRKAADELQQAELARDDYELNAMEQRLINTQRQVEALKERIAKKRTDSKAQLEKSYNVYLRKAGRQPASTTPKKTTKSNKK